jgi:hypothetical protein
MSYAEIDPDGVCNSLFEAQIGGVLVHSLGGIEAGSLLALTEWQTLSNPLE